MKNVIFFFLSVMVHFGGYSQSSYTYNVEKVIDGIYVLKPVISELRWVTSNIVVIVNDQDVFVVDSGLLPSAGEEAIRHIKKLTSKPVKFLVNTHWHGDHWQGNGAFVNHFPGVEIIASTEGYKGIARNGMLWMRKFYEHYWSGYVQSYETAVKTGNSVDGKGLSADTLNYIKSALVDMNNDLEELKSTKPVYPTITFSDQLIIRSGQREIRVLYLGWGNTTGDAIVYLPQEKILITGDLVVYPSPYESGAFSREWLETSRKLTGFDFNYLIPGHGDVLHNASYLNYLNALFEEITRQMNAAFLAGKNNLEGFLDTVTHGSVTVALSAQYPDYSLFIRNLDPGFVAAAVRSSFQKAKEGKL
jgi:cyclase